jgi:uncharacterized protein (DUF2252 family)
MQTSDDARTVRLVEILTDAFSDLMALDPDAFRRKFRRMAADPYAFYRGSACVFYADVIDVDDVWADERTSRVWIQGDLHAENFGTYMDGDGRLVFDVNDFDEAYLGSFTWDLRRFAASMALLARIKAVPDTVIAQLLDTYLRAYLKQVRHFVDTDRDHDWALTLDNSEGAVRDALLEAQLSTRVDLLDKVSMIEEYRRRFRHSSSARTLGRRERKAVEKAYAGYLDTIPESKQLGSLTYELKDVIGVSGFGIGSAGLPAYSLLVEGHTQALENDVVLNMKQGNVAAPSRVVDDPRAREFFAHHGHRTAVSQRALQAHADPWLGWTELGGVGFVVAEYSPYQADLDWSVIDEPAEMKTVLHQLGGATAKVHCVSDQDTPGTPLVDFQTEDAIVDVVGDKDDEFIRDIVEFAFSYRKRVRQDHALFVEAFRNGQIPGVEPSK